MLSLTAHEPNTPHPDSRNILHRKACCGEITMDGIPLDASIATLRSAFSGDASVEVTHVFRGTGEPLGGAWYLSLDGNESSYIDAGANVEDVWSAISNLTVAGNVSVTGGVVGYNGEKSWTITFDGWNDPSRTPTPPVLALGGERLEGTRAEAHLEAFGTSPGANNRDINVSGWCVKAVMQVSSLLSSGDIDDCGFVASWREGATYTIPAFYFDSNAYSLEAALATVDRDVVGEIWVSREGTSASGGGIWNLTFVANARGRTPELLCGTDAEVFRLSDSSCLAIGGVFALEFEGNLTQDIPYNASAIEVKSSAS